MVLQWNFYFGQVVLRAQRGSSVGHLAEIDMISINWTTGESEAAEGQRESNGHETLLLNMKEWNS